MIKIATRSLPFSHRPGTSCLLPGTHLLIKIFPARLSFYRADLLLFHLDLECAGPVLDFTVDLDLEHAQIRVFGHTQNGYMRYVLRRELNTVILYVEKMSSGCLTCHIDDQSWQLAERQALPLPCALHEEPFCMNTERLSLGMHKKQEWEHVSSRLDFKEIFPIWLHLGRNIPPTQPSSASPGSACQGSLHLLSCCQAMVHERCKQEIIPAFKRLFLAGFEGILAPRLFDTEHQGILPIEEGVGKVSAIPLLTHGAALIRSLFFHEDKGVLSLLACLPSDFHAGRYVNLRTSEGHRLNFEWTKKEIRRVILYPVNEKELYTQVNSKIGNFAHLGAPDFCPVKQALSEGNRADAEEGKTPSFEFTCVYLKFSKHLKKCRVRFSPKEKGQIHELEDGLLRIAAPGRQPVFIDCFQK